MIGFSNIIIILFLVIPSFLILKANGKTSPFVASTIQNVKLSTHFTSTTYTSKSETTVTQRYPWSMNADQYGYLATEVLATDSAWDATLHVLGMMDNGMKVKIKKEDKTQIKLSKFI